MLISCGNSNAGPAEVLEEYLLSISSGDCEKALELSTITVVHAQQDICAGNNDVILSIDCNEEDDKATCKVRVTREDKPFNLPAGRYTFNYTYSMTRESDEWKVADVWKSVNIPEESYLNQ